MAKIRKEDIIENNAIASVTTDLKAMLQVVKELKVELSVGLKNATKDLGSKPIIDASNLKEASQGIEEVTAATKELQRLEKEEVRLQAQLSQAESKQAQEVQKLRVKKQELNKVTKQQARESLGLVSLYEKESRRLNDLRKRYKDLALAEGEGSRAARKLRQEIEQLDTKLKKVDASTGQFQRNVGNYSKSMKGALKQTLRFGMGLAGGAGLISIFRNGISTVRNFEQSVANLGAITGTTGTPELERLSGAARELGATTVFTASEIATLQTELAKLGFSTSEILDSTEAISQLAAATGTDLAEAATVTGATVRAFGLNADEAGRVVDVMTASFGKSALDMSKFSTAMSSVAPVAANAGFSIEQTTAFLGKLVDSGIDASTAGTGLRNVF
jgi:hypothetical protein